MKLLSLLPLLYIYSQNSGRRVFSRVEISPIQELPRTHKINKSWDFKKQEPHEQRNRQEGKPRKQRTPRLHKSKHFAKANSTITITSQQQETRKKGYPESSLHQLTGSVFLSLKSPSDTAIPKHENFRNIARRHRYHKTPYHTQCISPQLPSLIRRLKKMHGTHSAPDDATTDRATVRADR